MNKNLNEMESHLDQITGNGFNPKVNEFKEFLSQLDFENNQLKTENNQLKTETKRLRHEKSDLQTKLLEMESLQNELMSVKEERDMYCTELREVRNENDLLIDKLKIKDLLTQKAKEFVKDVIQLNNMNGMGFFSQYLISILKVLSTDVCLRSKWFLISKYYSLKT